jgi:multiple sugar transport system substrate-binding protein
MKIRKIISIVITIAMAISLAACGEKKNTPTTTNSVNSTSSENTLQNKTIKVSAWADILTPNKDNLLDNARKAKVEAVEKKYGVSFEYVVLNDPTTQMQLAGKANDPIADIYCMRSYWVPPLQQSGYLYSLDDLGLSKDDKRFTQSAITDTTIGGKTYGFYFDPDGAMGFLVFNKSMFDRMGVAYPYELVKQKKWTFNAWRDVMKKLIKTDTSGKISQWGVINGESYQTLMMHANNGSFFKNVNGKYVQALTDKKVLEAMQFLYEIQTKDNLMEPYLFGGPWEYSLTAFREGRAGFIMTGFFGIELYLKGKMKDDYGVVPFPIGPSATDYKNITGEIKTFAVPTTASKDEAALKAKAFCEAWEYPFDKTQGLKEYYQSMVGDKESVDILMDLASRTPEVMKEYGSPRVIDPLIDLLYALAGQKPLMATLQSYEDAVQKELDTYYKQK